MPQTRLTIALNANQSVKSPLLVPAIASHDASLPSAIRSLVLKAAHSKLRVKKPARVFVAGTGKELLTEDDWMSSSMRDDVTLLISAGEDYVGVRKEEESGLESKSEIRSISMHINCWY
jgi:hypothetical protein